MEAVHLENHPAAEWAQSEVSTTGFSETDVDCTATVALKILDGKCKMLPGEKNAVLAVYDVVKDLPGKIFEHADHETIAMARKTGASDATMQRIHQLRVYAESKIPKPVMKAYKARLRDGLFG